MKIHFENLLKPDCCEIRQTHCQRSELDPRLQQTKVVKTGIDRALHCQMHGKRCECHVFSEMTIVNGCTVLQ